jgi:hypothetical protein
VEVAGDESSSHVHPGLGRPSRSMLEFPPRCSNSSFRRTAAAMLPAASGRRGSPSTSMPCSCLRPLLAGGSLTSTPLSPFSTRLTPPARGCTAAVSGLYLRVHAKNCKLPTTSCCPATSYSLYYYSSLPMSWSFLSLLVDEPVQILNFFWLLLCEFIASTCLMLCS